MANIICSVGACAEDAMTIVGGYAICPDHFDRYAKYRYKFLISPEPSWFRQLSQERTEPAERDTTAAEESFIRRFTSDPLGHS